MALFAMTPMALGSALRYHLNLDIPINLPLVGLVAIGVVLGSLIGSRIVFNIPDVVPKRMFACFQPLLEPKHSCEVVSCISRHGGSAC